MTRLLCLWTLVFGFGLHPLAYGEGNQLSSSFEKQVASIRNLSIVYTTEMEPLLPKEVLYTHYQKLTFEPSQIKFTSDGSKYFYTIKNEVPDVSKVREEAQKSEANVAEIGDLPFAIFDRYLKLVPRVSRERRIAFDDLRLYEKTTTPLMVGDEARNSYIVMDRKDIHERKVPLTYLDLIGLGHRDLGNENNPTALDASRFIYVISKDPDRAKIIEESAKELVVQYGNQQLSFSKELDFAITRRVIRNSSDQVVIDIAFREHRKVGQGEDSFYLPHLAEKTSYRFDGLPDAYIGKAYQLDRSRVLSAEVNFPEDDTTYRLTPGAGEFVFDTAIPPPQYLETSGVSGVGYIQPANLTELDAVIREAAGKKQTPREFSSLYIGVAVFALLGALGIVAYRYVVKSKT